MTNESDTPTLDEQEAWAQALVDDTRMPHRLRAMHQAILASLRELSAARQCVAEPVDTEAIAWAIAKMDAFGVSHSTQENALMVDRLTDMLYRATTAEAERDAIRLATIDECAMLAENDGAGCKKDWPAEWHMSQRIAGSIRNLAKPAIRQLKEKS